MGEHRIGELYRKALARFEDTGRASRDLGVMGSADGSASARQTIFDSMSMIDGSQVDVDILAMRAGEDRVLGIVTTRIRIDDMVFTLRTTEVADLVDGEVGRRWTVPDVRPAIDELPSKVG